MKTNELSGIALDYAVVLALGGEYDTYDSVATHWVKLNGESRALSRGWAQSFTPSTNWAQAGEIIETEKLSLRHYKEHNEEWFSEKQHFGRHHKAGRSYGEGTTPLIAAMRCYVSSKLGDEVEIPKELLQ